MLEILQKPVVIDEARGTNWQLYLGDACEVIKGLPDNSIDFGIHSPPFSNLYIYSDSEADMGNAASDAEFIAHYEFLIRELLRVTVTGRLCAVHCKDLPKYANRDDTAGLKDFPGDIIRAFCGGEAAEIDAAMRRIESRQREAEAVGDMSRVNRLTRILCDMRDELQSVPPSGGGWSFHSRITIWKCPVVERERTNNNGLLHKTVLRDRSQLRQGMADYVLLFRKPPTGTLLSDKPIAETRINRQYDESTGYVDVAEDVGFEFYVGSADCDPRNTDRHPSRFARGRGKKSGDEHLHQSSIHVWRRYAEPVWWDIDQMDVLNYKTARGNKDERHICPLQMGLIERCVHIWSLPGEVVLSPFAGIGSEGVGAVRLGRKFVGIELKPEYFKIATHNLQTSELSRRTEPTLFDLDSSNETCEVNTVATEEGL